MEYRVELSERAQHDLENLREFISQTDSAAAATWLIELEEAILSLEQFPRRCPIIKESKLFGRQLRHLLHGKRPGVYPIIYEVSDAMRSVRIVTIRHSAMDEFVPGS